MAQDPERLIDYDLRCSNRKLKPFGLKECKLCHQALTLESFSKSGTSNWKGKKSIVTKTICQKCNAPIAKKEYWENRERYLATNKKWRMKPENRKVQNLRTTAWRKANPEKSKETARAWGLKNRDRVNAHQRDRYAKQPKQWKQDQLNYSRNRYNERIQDPIQEAIIKEAAAKVRKKRASKLNKYVQNRYREDDQFRARILLKRRLQNALKRQGIEKDQSTLDLLGCSLSFFLGHIDLQFDSWMTFDNHPLWNYDHIIPCAYFDLTDPEQQMICFHWTNFQPLEQIENIKKGDSLSQEQFELVEYHKSQDWIDQVLEN